MDDAPVNYIRESTREILKLNRRSHRNEVSDLQRSIKDLRLSPENISSIVQNLKSKSHVTVENLLILKNALIDDEKNIEVVLKCYGALRGLVRELTGNNVSKQCAAAGCCCNLALGDSRACTAIAKAAGPYLTVLLDNPITELAMTCAWTLGNLAGSGPKVCDILVAQGAVSKLCNMLQIHNENIQDAAVYALLHFAYQMEDDFKPEHLQKVLIALSKLEVNATTSRLSFTLSCHVDFKDNMPEELIDKMLATLKRTVKIHSENCVRSQCDCELLYAERTLANMNVEVYDIILNYFLENNLGEVLLEVLNKDSGSVNESLLWLLGNLYNYSPSNDFFKHLSSL
ncbi:hypothetical protein RR46_05508 [Papilio xuthus]|uniref:Uncharacterized protein n=1 Tax=Papilio xuthus TaxID=66420 RepID=A0A194Q2U8_PAPXU|nr:hypothetical protein RR46_05508 [Papilio xuthus]